MACAAVSLLAYVVIRAARIPIVYDEAFSYLNFVSKPFGTILSINTPEPVNNHILNSLLSRLSVLAFGPLEWALRLPNVIAFVLYLACGIALCRRCTRSLPGVCGFLLFAANPFPLEFFALSRGYGLGLAFLSLALLLFVRAEEGRGSARRELILGGLCGFLAALSNLAFLLPVLMLVVVSAARNRRDLGSWAPALLVAPLLVAGFLGPRIVALKRAGQFYAGGTRGFLADTAGSLVRMTVKGFDGGPFAIAITGALAAALLVLGLLGSFVPSKAGGRRTAQIVTAVLVLAALGSVTQHVLARTPYLEDRTALFFLPLLALGAAGGLDALASSHRSAVRIQGQTFGIALSVGATVVLVLSANADHTTIWRYDADALRIVDDLAALHNEGLHHVRLGGNWIFEPALNFYRETRRLSWLEKVVGRRPLDECNVALTAEREPVALPRDEFTERRHYPISGNTLFVRVRPVGSDWSRPY